MFNRRSFKSDDSFLEKISIGAIGTQRVFQNLRQQGHQPIELERGSMSYKIWKSIKIKRIRVPDILLLNLNCRVESRAKTMLAISMSHSFSNQDRAWDSGLEDTDYVALVGVRKAGDRPIDWVADELVQYVSVAALRSAYQNDWVVREKPKGAQEGFEERVTWTASIASVDGTIESVSADQIRYRRMSDNRTMPPVRMTKSRFQLAPQVTIGERVVANQILASVVPITREISDVTAVDPTIYIQQLQSVSQSERYTAAKALFYFDSQAARSALASKIADSKDHIYVRLDSAASLARLGDDRGYRFIADCLNQPFVENQLEAVIVLGEVGTQQGITLLVSTLQNEALHSEVRAGAAWALGELRDKNSLPVLIQSFNAVESIVRIEAARALAKLAEQFTPELIEWLPMSGSSEKPGIAWALSQSARFSVSSVIEALRDIETRRWVAYMIGSQAQSKYIDQIEMLKQHDPEVYFATTVLWQIMSSWVYNLEMYG
jgi:hypothetical protein